MKQYCRYCANCIYGDIPYCDIKKQTMNEAYIKRVNNCKDYNFCNIDVISGKDYSPRKQKAQKQADECSLF